MNQSKRSRFKQLHTPLRLSELKLERNKLRKQLDILIESKASKKSISSLEENIKKIDIEIASKKVWLVGQLPEDPYTFESLTLEELNKTETELLASINIETSQGNRDKLLKSLRKIQSIKQRKLKTKNLEKFISSEMVFHSPKGPKEKEKGVEAEGGEVSDDSDTNTIVNVPIAQDKIPSSSAIPENKQTPVFHFPLGKPTITLDETILDESSTPIYTFKRNPSNISSGINPTNTEVTFSADQLKSSTRYSRNIDLPKEQDRTEEQRREANRFFDDLRANVENIPDKPLDSNENLKFANYKPTPDRKSLKLNIKPQMSVIKETYESPNFNKIFDFDNEQNQKRFEAENYINMRKRRMNNLDSEHKQTNFNEDRNRSNEYPPTKTQSTYFEPNYTTQPNMFQDNPHNQRRVTFMTEPSHRQMGDEWNFVPNQLSSSAPNISYERPTNIRPNVVDPYREQLNREFSNNSRHNPNYSNRSNLEPQNPYNMNSSMNQTPFNNTVMGYTQPMIRQQFLRRLKEIPKFEGASYKEMTDYIQIGDSLYNSCNNGLEEEEFYQQIELQLRGEARQVLNDLRNRDWGALKEKLYSHFAHLANKDILNSQLENMKQEKDESLSKFVERARKLLQEKNAAYKYLTEDQKHEHNRTARKAFARGITDIRLRNRLITRGANSFEDAVAYAIEAENDALYQIPKHELYCGYCRQNGHRERDCRGKNGNNNVIGPLISALQSVNMSSNFNRNNRGSPNRFNQGWNNNNRSNRGWYNNDNRSNQGWYNNGNRSSQNWNNNSRFGSGWNNRSSARYGQTGRNSNWVPRYYETGRYSPPNNDGNNNNGNNTPYNRNRYNMEQPNNRSPNNGPQSNRFQQRNNENRPNQRFNNIIVTGLDLLPDEDFAGN